MSNGKLQDARQYWLSMFVENLQLDAPMKEISGKMTPCAPNRKVREGFNYTQTTKPLSYKNL